MNCNCERRRLAARRAAFFVPTARGRPRRRACAGQQVDVQIDRIAAINNVRDINCGALVADDDTWTFGDWRPRFDVRKIGGHGHCRSRSSGGRPALRCSSARQAPTILDAAGIRRGATIHTFGEMDIDDAVRLPALVLGKLFRVVLHRVTLLWEMLLRHVCDFPEA